MKQKVKFLLVVIFLIFLASLAYLFLFGKLFPYAPVVIGFSSHELTQVIVYCQYGAEYNRLSLIDSLIPGVEQFHDLKFLRKPELFIFKDRNSYLRRSLSKARFCTFYNSKILIAPWALEEANRGTLSLSIYLKHELSHSLLYQHLGLLNSFRFPQWLIEGIATYSAGQMGTTFYPGKQETFAHIRQGNFMPPQYFRTKKEAKVKLTVKNRIPFLYSEFACIVDFLITNYGRESFLVYMKRLLREHRHDQVFDQVFKIPFERFISDWKDAVIQAT